MAVVYIPPALGKWLGLASCNDFKGHTQMEFWAVLHDLNTGIAQEKRFKSVYSSAGGGCSSLLPMRVYRMMCVQ